MNIRDTILGLLMYGPQTGYELKQAFDSSLGFFAGASFGSIYPILRKCSQDGLVKMEREIQDGKPNRKIYSLTDKGREEFLGSAAATLALSPYRNEFLVRLFFFDFIEPGRRAGVIEEYLTHLRGKAAALEQIKPAVREHADTFQAACYDFGVRYIKDLMKNIDRLRKDLARADARGTCCRLFPPSRRGGKSGETEPEEEGTT